MTRLGLSFLAVALAAASGVVYAQSHPYGDAPYGDYSHRTQSSGSYRDDGARGYGNMQQGSSQYGGMQGATYEWARVVRVDPVVAYGRNNVPVSGQRNCQTRRDYYASNDPYRDDGYGDGYDPYRDDGYRDDYPRDTRRDENGRMVATVLGGIAGAVLGSKIGDGSGQYIGTAVGSMVGGMAGRGIYDSNRRQRDARDGYVTTCDPEPYYGGDGYYNTGGYPGDRAVSEYDVTYEYGGRRYVTRTNHHPGDRIRVRVDVRAE